MSILNNYQQVAGKIISSAGNPGNALQAGSGNYSLPWGKNGKSSVHDDPFFQPIDIKPERWDKVFPYRLLVVDVSKPGIPQVVERSSGGKVSEIKAFNKDTGGVQISMTAPTNKWEFQLPITPQQISITDQFAINTTATMRGVVEEHNGVKFKILTASGTLGLWANRKNVDITTGVDKKGEIAAILGGTIDAFGNTLNSVNRIKNVATTGLAATPPQSPDPLKDFGGTATGYFQARLMEQFLEQYAMAKKNPNNKGWRLVFDYPKENQAFIVTPQVFRMGKDQTSPGEEKFNLQFKVWKRINIKSSISTTAKSVIPLDSNTFQKIVNTLSEARKLLSNSVNLVKAIRADFRRPFEVLRQASLFVKDLGGLAFSIADLPNNIISDIESSLLSSAVNLERAFSRTKIDGTDPSGKDYKTFKKIVAAQSLSEGLSKESVQAGAIGRDAAHYQKADSLNNVFREPESNFTFFNTIKVDDIKLNHKQKQAINDEVDSISLISVEDIKSLKTEIESLSLDISDNLGGSSTEYSQFYDRPIPTQTTIALTPENIEISVALENVILDLNTLTSTRTLDDNKKQNPLEYVGGLAQDSNITFNSTSSSKILVPVPFNLTIEQIAARYLKDPDRWVEIATLNNLRSPYIDEDGFFYNLLSNGGGRQFNINSNVDLYVGQVILLSSNTVISFSRKITYIEKIAESNYLITVDGLDDLESLKVSENAKIQAFLPGTVNSQNQIFIPSEIAVSDEPRFFDIPYLVGDDLTGLSKIDFLLDDSGDVAINGYGDFRLATGITNLVQALKMKVLTPKGKILGEAGYGIGLKPGVVTSDIEIDEIFKDIISMIDNDPRFDGLDKLDVTILPPDTKIEMSVRLANGKGVFPITFTTNG